MITSQYEDSILADALIDYLISLPGGISNPYFKHIINMLYRIYFREELSNNDIQ